MAERVGFEPTVRCRITGFQDRLLKPLGHLSMLAWLLYQKSWSAVNSCVLLCAAVSARTPLQQENEHADNEADECGLRPAHANMREGESVTECTEKIHHRQRLLQSTRECA